MGVVTGAAAPFNGGTITNELIVNTGSGTGQALELQGTRTVGNPDVFRIDYPHTVFVIESDGGLTLSSDDNATAQILGTGTGGANLSIGAASANSVLTSLGTSSGISIFQQGTGSAGIQVSDALGNQVFACGVSYGGGILTSPQRSGALPTTTFVSGTGKQVDVFQDRHLVVPFTGDATNNAATLLIQLSPDNTTYSTLDTLSIAAALNLTGAINTPVSLYVPAAWYVKLTATHGTIGTGTYY